MDIDLLVPSLPLIYIYSFFLTLLACMAPGVPGLHGAPWTAWRPPEDCMAPPLGCMAPPLGCMAPPWPAWRPPEDCMAPLLELASMVSSFRLPFLSCFHAHAVLLMLSCFTLPFHKHHYVPFLINIHHRYVPLSSAACLQPPVERDLVLLAEPPPCSP